MKHVLTQSGYQPTVKVEHQDYLFFGGTSYLGLNYHPEYLANFCEGLQKWGLNNGASRNNNITLNIYHEGENLLAKNHLAEAAVTFSSGWLAAQTAVEVLQKGRETIYLNDAHPALMLTPQPIINLDSAVALINASRNQQFLLVSNSVNNIYPQIFDFSALSEIKSNKDIILLLDHSHGFGYLHENWLKDLQGLPKNISLMLCGSLAKGLSLDAGVVIGSKIHIDLIKGSQVFNGASPCSPAVLFTYLNSQKIISQASEKLNQNLTYFFNNCNEDDYYWVEKLPVILIKKEQKASELIKKNIVFTSFPYPKPESPTLNRLILMASHSQDILKTLF